jgi:hypothetical protein
MSNIDVSVNEGCIASHKIIVGEQKRIRSALFSMLRNACQRGKFGKVKIWCNVITYDQLCAFSSTSFYKMT